MQMQAYTIFIKGQSGYCGSKLWPVLSADDKFRPKELLNNSLHIYTTCFVLHTLYRHFWLMLSINHIIIQCPLMTTQSSLSPSLSL